jgi:hypothetical protein
MTSHVKNLAALALASGAFAAVAVSPAVGSPAPATGPATQQNGSDGRAAGDPTPRQVARIERFFQSGAWARETNRVIKRATASLRASVRRSSDPSRLVAVFDIDDTALSTYNCMKAGGFTQVRLVSCVLSGPLPAIAQTRQLFSLAQRLRVRVAFITGRPESVRSLTLTALHTAGYAGQFQLVMRPANDMRSSVVPYKSSARNALQRGGRRVVINVGDQRSDLAGGFAQHRFKLPNPMYTTP